MGDGNFLLPPQNPRPLTDHQKLLKVITLAAPTAGPNLVQIRLWQASGQMVDRYIMKIRHLFIYLLYKLNRLQCLFVAKATKRN